MLSPYSQMLSQHFSLWVQHSFFLIRPISSHPTVPQKPPSMRQKPKSKPTGSPLHSHQPWSFLDMKLCPVLSFGGFTYHPANSTHTPTPLREVSRMLDGCHQNHCHEGLKWVELALFIKEREDTVSCTRQGCRAWGGLGKGSEAGEGGPAESRTSQDSAWSECKVQAKLPLPAQPSFTRGWCGHVHTHTVFLSLIRKCTSTFDLKPFVLSFFSNGWTWGLHPGGSDGGLPNITPPMLMLNLCFSEVNLSS